MHRSYDISNDDMRSVLCTFVVVPKGWIDTYGWRRLSDHELQAFAVYYRTLGDHMGIKGVPRTFEEFERTLDAYEDEHFGWDESARKVSDATLALMASWCPGPLAPVLRKASLGSSMMRCCGRSATNALARPPVVSRAMRCGCGRVPCDSCRSTAHYARQNPEIKGYPDGYEIGGLGTFSTPGTGGCPVPHNRWPGAPVE